MKIKFLRNVFFALSLLVGIGILGNVVVTPFAGASYLKASTITPAQINALGIPAAWNAASNIPAIASGVTYAPTNSLTVTVAGTLNLNVGGVNTPTVWSVGDLLYFDGTNWQQISNSGGSVTVPASGIMKAVSSVLTTAVAGTDYGSPIAQQGVIDLLYAASGVYSSSVAGALTLATAIPNTLSQGFYNYSPASAVNATQTAGWYWCVGSSTTLAQCYNNQYYPASAVAAVIPASNTPFSTANTPGTSYANTLSAYLPFASVNVPANVLGVRGSISTLLAFNNNNSSQAKTCGLTYGGNGTGAPPIIQSNTTATGFINTMTMFNVGNLTYQKWSAAQATYSGSQYYANVNSAVAQSLWISCELSTSGTTDYVMLQQYTTSISSAP